MPPVNRNRLFEPLSQVRTTILQQRPELFQRKKSSTVPRQPNYSHEDSAFDRMVEVVGRLTDKFRTVRGIVGELESLGCGPRAQTFLLLLRIYWRGGMFRMVFEAFEEMIKFNYTPNTFARNVLMDCLFKIGHVDAALSVLNGTYLPNFLTFNIALCNLCKFSDLANVRNVIRTMLRERYVLDAETMTMVLNCFCKMRRLGEAFQVLGIMISMGIPASVRVWSILIDAWCKSGRLAMAGDLVKKMTVVGCSPNVVTYTSLVRGFLKTGMLSCASSILGTMESSGCAPDLVLHNVLIDCLSKIGRHDAAIELFLSLLKQKVMPDHRTLSSCLSAVCGSRKYSLFPKLIEKIEVEADLVMCNHLLFYFCKAGVPLHAMKFYQSMLERGIVPDKYTFVELLRGMCGVGWIDEAVNVYRGIIHTHPGLDAHVHTVMIGELMSAGRFDTAIRLLRGAVAEKYPLDDVSYNVLLRLFTGSNIEDARALFNLMKEGGVAPTSRTYNVLLCGFCVRRDRKMVKWILEEMTSSRSQLQYNTFMKVSNFLFRTDFPGLVSGLLSEMWSLGLMPKESKYPLLFDGVKIGVLPISGA